MKQALKNNYLLIGTFVCFVVALEMLRAPVYGGTLTVMLTCVPGSYDFVDTLLPMFVMLADAAVLSLPALFVRRRRWIVYAWIALFCCYVAVERMYMHVYHDAMPFSHFLLWGNVNGTLLRSAGGLFGAGELVAFLPLVVLIFVGRKLPEPRRYGRGSVLSVIGCALAGYAVGAAYNVSRLGRNYSITQPYTTMYKACGYICDNGFVPYVVYSVVTAVTPDRLSDDDRRRIESYLSGQPRYTDNSYASPQRRNVIVIVVESLNSWMLDRTVCGVEVMPHVDSLLHREGTVAALKLLPQVKDGRSSDGHFIINTGLLPLSSGSVATSYAHNRRYPSLARALKRHGYTSFNMVCDQASAWNQQELAQALGFDRFYDCTAQSTGDDLSDEAMLRAAVDSIAASPKPVFAHLVTLNTHQPYRAPDSPTALSRVGAPRRVAYALEAFHRLDAQIGDFLDRLRRRGLLENSIVAIVSDHNDVDLNELEGREPTVDDTYCAMIVTGTVVTKSIDTSAGQVDIYPTLLDLAGCNDYSWKGLGSSLLRREPASAAYCDGTLVGADRRTLEAWDVSRRIIKGNYFAK